MKVLKSKKAIICLLSISSIVVAGTIKDIHSRNLKLQVPEAIAKSIIPVERSVASEMGVGVAQLYLPMNSDNIKKINTAWEITRIVGNDKIVAFDKLSNAEDSKKSIKVPMELIGNGLVRVNKDNEQVYQVSLLSDFGTIALYKKLGNGYEILEAKKIQTTSSKTSLIVGGDVELVLERALNQAKSNKILEGNNVSGQVSLSTKNISGLEVELRNPNGETQNIEISSAELMDGGAFRSEVNGEEVSGVVLNNGKDGYRISFVTGPIAGAMLNFVTREQLEKIQENEQNSYSQVSDEQLSVEKVLEERKEVASDADKYEPVRVLSADEIKETAEQKGFSF
jgi:hypothetical protein